MPQTSRISPNTWFLLFMTLVTVSTAATVAFGQDPNQRDAIVKPIAFQLSDEGKETQAEPSNQIAVEGSDSQHSYFEASQSEESYGSVTPLIQQSAMDNVTQSKDFCEWWHDLGTLHSKPEFPIVQELKFIGRFHYQYGLVDGSTGGTEVDYETHEMRRFRAGFTTKFFKVWDLYAESEISDDQRPRGADLDIRFQHMWQFKFHLDAKKAFGLQNVDGFKIGMGSREINMSYEWVTSSKRIKTVERSAIANKIWAFNSEFANPTGVWFITDIKPMSWTVGVFSTTQHDWIAPFNDGELFYSNFHWDVFEGPDGEETDLRWNTFFQDVTLGQERLSAGLDWATALSFKRKRGPWEWHIEAIAGNNGDQTNPNREGNFWAIVWMPSYWIVKDDLEAVFRYQYQGASESEGIRLNSRYIRRAGAREGFPTLTNGRGDEHHSYYFGVNKLLCGHQQKIMGGVEYDTLRQNNVGRFGGWSVFASYRNYW